MNKIGLTLSNSFSSNRDFDYYPTPSEVTEALMMFLIGQGFKLNEMSCLEPACGTGEMSKVLEKYFKYVRSSDIRQTGYGDCGKDYLSDKYTGFDCIITNPPFMYSQAFIEKALGESDIVAMLCKSQYWHSKKRRELFLKNLPAYILPLTWRPNFNPEQKGSPTMEVLWTVWVRGEVSCVYYPLAREIKIA